MYSHYFASLFYILTFGGRNLMEIIIKIRSLSHLSCIITVLMVLTYIITIVVGFTTTYAISAYHH